jgi:hypothetical protein
LASVVFNVVLFESQKRILFNRAKRALPKDIWVVKLRSEVMVVRPFVPVLCLISSVGLGLWPHHPLVWWAAQ